MSSDLFLIQEMVAVAGMLLEEPSTHATLLGHTKGPQSSRGHRRGARTPSSSPAVIFFHFITPELSCRPICWR